MAKTPTFGELLIEALEEAVAHSQGKLPQAKTTRVSVTARSAVVAPPPRYDAERIRAIRNRLNLSQPVFAGLLNVSDASVKAWERGVRAPEGPTMRLLEVADQHPDALLAAMSAPGREARANRSVARGAGGAGAHRPNKARKAGP
jgi:putative transcriptional regulator